VSYRPSKHDPKGTWARHLHAQRKARDLSQVAAFELVYERIGWSPKSRTAYGAIDMGLRAPKPDEATVLAAEFGWPPDPVDAEPTDDVPALVAAIRAQTDAITALVGRLDVLTEGQATAAGEMMRALGILGGRPGPQGTPPEGEREARGGTGR
jgi:hypothetical protein